MRADLCCHLLRQASQRLPGEDQDARDAHHGGPHARGSSYTFKKLLTPETRKSFLTHRQIGGVYEPTSCVTMFLISLPVDRDPAAHLMHIHTRV